MAAALAIAVIGRGGVSTDPRPSGTVIQPVQNAGLGETVLDGAEALKRYLSQGRAEGRVVGEQPMRLLECEPLLDGGYRVLYVRSILESAVVNAPYRVTTDDLSQTGGVQMQPVQLQPRFQKRRLPQ
jgi:hypothetical protein